MRTKFGVFRPNECTNGDCDDINTNGVANAPSASSSLSTTKRATYLITSPVELRSLAIWGIEGINVPVVITDHHSIERSLSLEEKSVIQATRSPHDTMATKSLFFCGENRS